MFRRKKDAEELSCGFEVNYELLITIYLGERGTFPSTLYLSLQMYKNLLYLYLFILPFCFFEINITCYQQQAIIHNLNRKANFDRCFQPHSDENDV